MRIKTFYYPFLNWFHYLIAEFEHFLFLGPEGILWIWNPWIAWWHSVWGPFICFEKNKMKKVHDCSPKSRHNCSYQKGKKKKKSWPQKVQNIGALCNHFLCLAFGPERTQKGKTNDRESQDLRNANSVKQWSNDTHLFKNLNWCFLYFRKSRSPMTFLVFKPVFLCEIFQNFRLCTSTTTKVFHIGW